MMELLFANGAAWFTVPAFIGTGVFLIRLGLMLVGGIAADMDISLDAADLAHGSVGHDSTHAFQVLSIQSISTFIMGFGWGGLAGLHVMGWGWPASAGAGCAIGVAFVYLLAVLLGSMMKLQSSGNISAEDAIGVEGVVYVGLPGSNDPQTGSGKVRLVVNSRQRIYTAVPAGGTAIPTSSRVRVVGVNGDNTLRVEPV